MYFLCSMRFLILETSCLISLVRPILWLHYYVFTISFFFAVSLEKLCRMCYVTQFCRKAKCERLPTITLAAKIVTNVNAVVNCWKHSRCSKRLDVTISHCILLYVYLIGTKAVLFSGFPAHSYRRCCPPF